MSKYGWLNMEVLEVGARELTRHHIDFRAGGSTTRTRPQRIELDAYLKTIKRRGFELPYDKLAQQRAMSYVVLAYGDVDEPRHAIFCGAQKPDVTSWYKSIAEGMASARKRMDRERAERVRKPMTIEEPSGMPS